MAKYLGTESYGVNSQTNTIVTFLIPIATLGLGFGVVRFISGNQTAKAVSLRFYSTLSVTFLVSLALSALVFIFAPEINNLLIKVDWAPTIIRWSAPLIVLSAIEMTIKDYYRARLRIISYSVFQIFQTIAYVAGVSVILINGGKLIHVVWLWLGIKIVFNILTYIYFVFICEVEIKPTFMEREELLGLLRFGIPIVIAGLGSWVTKVGDRWVIGYFMTINDVAVYNAAYTLAGIIAALASPFWNPLYPLMSTHFNNNDLEALYKTTRKYTNAFCLITIPSVVGLILLANPLLIVLGSKEFSIQPLTFSLIIIGLFFDQFSASIHYKIYLHNDPKFIRNAILISGVANVIFNFIAVPLLGITGAALATFLTYLLLDTMLFTKVITYGIRIRDIYDFSSTLKFLISSLAMIIPVLIYTSNNNLDLPGIIAAAGIGACTYGLTLLAFYKFNPRRLIDAI